MAKDKIKDVIKARLGEYGKLREDCARLCRKIHDKREDMHYLKAVVSDSVARRSGDIADQVERAIELMDGLIAHYTHLVTEREEAERRVLDMLERVENGDGRRILYLHYIEGLSFDDVAEELSISGRTMWTKYKMALDELCALEQDEPA